jgi:hypothetical protein
MQAQSGRNAGRLRAAQIFFVTELAIGAGMRHRLIDWVDAKCWSWGLSARRIYLNSQDRHWPESVWARIQDGIPPSEFADQRFLEVHEGDALTIAKLLPVLTEPQRVTMIVHYVAPGPLKQKLFRIGKHASSHYEMLAWVHRKLANAVEHGYPEKIGACDAGACGL